MLRLLLVCLLAFPVWAQETVETPSGPVEVRPLNTGTAVLQCLPDRPVCAITLVTPWGRADQGGMAETLNRALARTSPGYPGGSLLTSLEQIGGRSSYQTGERFSSFSLIVPKGYASWALQIQMDRLSGGWQKGQEVALESYLLEHWDPSHMVIGLVGGFDAPSLKSQLSHLARSRGASNPSNTPLTAVAPRGGQLGWRFPRPRSAQSRAAAYLWQALIEEDFEEVHLDLDPAEDGYWLLTPCSDAGQLTAARNVMSSALPAASLMARPSTRARALQNWLAHWDDLQERARRLALEQARGELGSCLQVGEALQTYDLNRWQSDLAFASAETRTESLSPVAVGTPSRTAPGKPGPPPKPAPASPPPAFVRLEYAPGCGALVQTLHDVPVVAIRAVIPGGSSCDLPHQAGRAEWLAACWQAAFPGDCPTTVEAQPYGWQFSAYLPREQAGVWLTRFYQLFQQPLKVQPQPPPTLSPILEDAYHEWLRLLFPEQHPLGRQGRSTPIAQERLAELNRDVQQRGRWSVFLSGDITPQEVEALWKSSPPPLPQDQPSLPSWEGLPTQEQLPSQPVIRSANVSHCTILMGGFAPSRREADYYAFVLLMQALAADPIRSRLQLELRHKNPLALRVDCNFLSSSGPSPWLVRIDCPADRLGQVQEKLQAQLAELRSKELRQEELDLAITRLEGLQQLSNLNASGRVTQLRNLDLFRLSDSYNQGFAGIYRNISRKDVLQAARLRLAPERIVTLILTPKT